EPDKIAVVRQAFEQFGNELRSMRQIAGDLNARKVPPPAGKAWYAKTVGLILRQRAYRGDFLFNRVHAGAFYGIDAEGEVVEAEELKDAEGKLLKGKVFTTEGVYEPVVDAKLFDKVQVRLDTLTAAPGRRNHKDYALTGVLFCGHCGTAMYGVRVHRGGGKRSPTVYRCNATSVYGKGTCKQYQV